MLAGGLVRIDTTNNILAGGTGKAAGGANRKQTKRTLCFRVKAVGYSEKVQRVNPGLISGNTRKQAHASRLHGIYKSLKFHSH